MIIEPFIGFISNVEINVFEKTNTKKKNVVCTSVSWKELQVNWWNNFIIILITIESIEREN